MLLRINIKINKKIVILVLLAILLLAGGIIIGRLWGKKEVSVGKSGKAVGEKINLASDIFPQVISEDFSLYQAEEIPLTGCYVQAKKAFSAIYERRSRSIEVNIAEYESNKKALEVPQFCTNEDAERLEVTPIFRQTGKVLGNPFWLYTTIPFNEEEIRYSYTVFENYLIQVMIPGQLGGTESWHQQVAEVFIQALKGEGEPSLPSSPSLKQYTFTAQNIIYGSSRPEFTFSYSPQLEVSVTDAYQSSQRINLKPQSEEIEQSYYISVDEPAQSLDGDIRIDKPGEPVWFGNNQYTRRNVYYVPENRLIMVIYDPRPALNLGDIYVAWWKEARKDEALNQVKIILETLKEI